jgi:Oxidoreductase-like protein, N-terminal
VASSPGDPPTELPPRPAPPEPGDCCGGGCARCVFDVHEELLERWRRQVDEILKQREQKQ